MNAFCMSYERMRKLSHYGWGGLLRAAASKLW